MSSCRRYPTLSFTSESRLVVSMRKTIQTGRLTSSGKTMSCLPKLLPLIRSDNSGCGVMKIRVPRGYECYEILLPAAGLVISSQGIPGLQPFRYRLSFLVRDITPKGSIYRVNRGVKTTIRSHKQSTSDKHVVDGTFA